VIAAAIGGHAGETPSDRDFLSRAAIGNLFEIESSRLAQSRSRKKAVRRFADNVVRDHVEAAAKLRQAAAEAGVGPPPVKLDDRHQVIMDQLRGKDGAAFDIAYIDSQFATHVEAVDLFRTYGQEGGNIRMKQFARELLPILNAHLEHVSRLR
jgi:putative membrane protein